MADNIFDMLENASPRDKILDYLKSSRKGNVYLSVTEEEYMLQLDYADDLIRAHPAARDKELINMLVEKYAISASKARNVLVDSRYVHGTMAKPVKAYERMRLKEFLWETAVHAAGVEKFKEANQAVELLMKLDQLDKPDEEQPDEQQGIFILRPTFAPETLGVPLPENIDELVASLRAKTKQHNNILTALNGGNG